MVAGTNGKGSVCATLEALLLGAGERIGLYTSPHLVETTERFRIAGNEITPELFVRAWEAVSRSCQEIRLTHFEALTLMAAWLFFAGEAVPPVDRAILEVGLGGTWDATNAIPHSFCIITRLGLDHQNLLGSSLGEIAANKFGIVTPGSRVVHFPLPPEARQLSMEVQESTSSRWIEASSDGYSLHSVPASSLSEGPAWLLQAAGPKIHEFPLSLPGARGFENTIVALKAFQELGYDPGRGLPVLSRVSWPGRMQRIAYPGSPCPVYLSGDHNPKASKACGSSCPPTRLLISGCWSASEGTRTWRGRSPGFFPSPGHRCT